MCRKDGGLRLQEPGSGENLSCVLVFILVRSCVYLPFTRPPRIILGTEVSFLEAHASIHAENSSDEQFVKPKPKPKPTPPHSAMASWALLFIDFD